MCIAINQTATIPPWYQSPKTTSLKNDGPNISRKF